MSFYPLLALPDELLVAITSFATLESISRLASTCKTIHRITRDILALQRKYHDEYNLRHDRSTFAVPELLRLAQRDSAVAWHIHHLEIWTLRWSWQDWHDYPERMFISHDGTAPHPTLGPRDTNTQLRKDNVYDPVELVQYEKLLRGSLHLSDEETELWMQRTRDGWDEMLKTLLIALAPGLRSLKFASFHGNDDYFGIYRDHMDCHPLRFLSTVISRLHSTPEAVWPIGLKSLREVSICTEHRSEQSFNVYSVPPTIASIFFLLPNLEVLRLHHIGTTDEDEPNLEMARGSSKLKELSLVNCEMPIEPVDQMIGSIRALKKCFIDDPVPTDYSELLECLRLHQAETLETVRFPGIRSTTSISLAGFEGLRSAELPLTGFLRETSSGNDENDCGPMDSCLPDLRPLFPKSIKEIVFNPPGAWTKRRDEASEVAFHMRKRIEQCQRELLYRVAELAEDKRSHGLKVVCLCKCNLTIDDQLAECFEALSRIKATGVSVIGQMSSLKGDERAWRRHVHLHETMRTPLDVLESEPEPAWKASLWPM